MHNNRLFIMIIGFLLIFVGLSCYSRKNQMEYPMLVKSIQTKEDLRNLFTWTAQDIKKVTEQYKQDVHKNIDALIAISDQDRTYTNTAAAFDAIIAYSNLMLAGNVFEVLHLASPQEEIRNACQEAIVNIEAFVVDYISNNKKIYQALDSYAKHNASKELLTDAQRYFLSETLESLRLAGLNKSDEELAIIKELKKTIQKIAIEFDKNIAQDLSTIIIPPDGLQGVDPNFLAALERTSTGDYILDTKYPTYYHVMEYCSVEETRKKLYYAFANRAYPANDLLLKELIAKRDELAHKLDMPSYAHYDLAQQMAKSPENAHRFLYDLITQAQQKEIKEVKEWFSDLPASVVLTGDGKIKPWDMMYLKSQYKKKYYDVDEVEISHYFSMDNTIAKLLEIYKQFFSVNFKEIAVEGLWYEDVRCIEVLDKSDNILGYILLDLYPRPFKYSHAGHITVIPARFNNGIREPEVSVLMTNFPKTTETKPSLLTRYDVNTFFHEFGHALHAMFGATDLASQSGTRVDTDFVEMPSQMLEEWLWDKNILKTISSHYQTGQPLSDELIEKIIRLKNFDTGSFVITQAFYALESLEYFAQGATKDPQILWETMFKKLKPHVAFVPDIHSYASFGHLTGYGAKYYGYLWAKVFALDLFEEIKKYGLLNPTIGNRYKECILSKGGSKDPNELLKDFLGREPNNKAFLTMLAD